MEIIQNNIYKNVTKYNNLLIGRPFGKPKFRIKWLSDDRHSTVSSFLNTSVHKLIIDK